MTVSFDFFYPIFPFYSFLFFDAFSFYQGQLC